MKIEKMTLTNFNKFSIKNLVSITGGTANGDGDVIIIDKNKKKRPGAGN